MRASCVNNMTGVAPTVEELRKLRRELTMFGRRTWLKEHERLLIVRTLDVLRHVPPRIGHKPTIYRCGELVFNVQRREVAIGARMVYLSPAQAALLALLCQAPGQVFTRRDIIEHGWGQFWIGNVSNYVDVCVRKLRRRLDPCDAQRFIRTTRAIGYYLAVDDGRFTSLIPNSATS